MWISQPMTRGNEFDRIPITVMRERNPTNLLLLEQSQEEFVTNEEGEQKKKKVVTKKPFLKRSAGKSVHQKPIKNNEMCEKNDNTAAEDGISAQDNNNF
jgi:hypothetical protein